MSLTALMQRADSWALFVDVDGTLLEIADTPQSVCVPPSVTQLLASLSVRLQGALALVSGRPIAELDALFAPLKLCASGVHGCERRDAAGNTTLAPVDEHRMRSAREMLSAFVGRHPGLLLEDKRYGFAVHFRRVPLLASDVRQQVESACARLGEDFSVLAGKCVFEVRPRGWTKGTSIAAHMQSPPFIGCTPIFVGDDHTDEEGFEVVNRLGGVTVKVGAEQDTLAQYRLRDVTAVHRWLETIPPSSMMRAGS